MVKDVNLAARRLGLEPGQPGGATAHVWRNTESGRATKLFFSLPDPVRSRKIFESQVAAFELVQGHPRLVHLTPAYYGRSSVASVVDEGGNDVSANYLSDCAYEMQLLPGPFYKIGDCVGSKNRSEIEAAFRAVGVRFMNDADVMLDRAGEIIKVIDFATEEFEPWA